MECGSVVGMPSRRKRARALWLALLAWAGLVLWLSSLRPTELPDAAFMFWDKVNHFVMFSLGGWLATAALRASKPRMTTAKAVLLAVLIIATFGLFDEMLQTFTPGRSGGDVYDWIADTLGGLTGGLLSLSAHRLSFRGKLEERR
jgi:VanZ family protein